jgi:predicted nucleic acid-binding protein
VKLFLVDSGALLAMIDARDAHHSTAATFVRANTNATFYLPDTIFTETMVLTKARLGAKPAIELGNRLMKSTHFHIVYLTAEDRGTTWDYFSRYTDKDWSYVDCSILALAGRLGVFEVFAFDHHIDQMAELIRLPPD